jgi:UDP-4-amino-4,6-dideoxy-N-acetyl-beta-L-altrosamine N-acetyltransferase
MKLAILTTRNQWFEKYAIDLSKKLKYALYFNFNYIKDFDVVFILNYHNIIPKNDLKKNKYNIVIHGSILPKGKGWSPLFWQVSKSKKEISFTMLEAGNEEDNDIYIQKTLKLSGNELNEELREKQAQYTIKMCKEFINNYEKYKIPIPQIGDKNNTIKEQFNLIKIINNDKYPAFFEIDRNRYILKIKLDKGMQEVELIDFVDLNIIEKKNILKLRNSNDIKKWMYNQNNISLDNHLAFIKSLELNPFQQNIMVKKGAKFIGVVNFIFDYKKNEVLFGLYTNIYEKITGLGRILEEVCIKYSFDIMKIKKLKLEVFSNNQKAISLYKKFNFQEVSKKEINNKKVICMELKNENR